MFKKGKIDDQRKVKQKADEAYAKGDWKKALEFYKDLMSVVAFDPRIVHRMGDLYKRLKQNAFAISEYKKVSDYYAREGYWAKAIAMNKMILDLDPENQEIQQSLARMYTAQIPPKEPQSEINLASLSGETPYNPEVNFGAVIDFDSKKSEAPEMIVDLNPQEQTVADAHTLGKPVRNSLKIPLFSDLTASEFVSVLGKLTIRRFPAGTLICEEGDMGNSMFVISEGIVEVFTKDIDGTRLTLARLKGGDFFGEYSLITQKERNASVLAKTDLEVLEITADDFAVISMAHPRIWTVLEDYLRRRMVHTIMMRSSVFHVLTEDERELLSKYVTSRKYSAGGVIMSEGTDGEEMFFIKAGSVTVTSEKNDTKISITELKQGDFFGEMAMLSGKKRTATIRAKSDVEVLVLRRVDAAKVFRGNRDVLVLLQSKMKERTRETYETLESYQEAQNTLSLV